MPTYRFPEGYIEVSEQIKSRFFAKTEETIISGVRHLLWTAFKDRDGYGRFGWNRQVGTVRAHVGAFVIAHNRKPTYQCLHKNECHVTSCVLDEHLYDGTPKQNVADSMVLGTAVMLSKEWHASSAEWHRGRTRPAETRRKMSLSQRGENHPCVKLKESEVVLIRELFSQGTDKQTLAERFFVTPTNITYIVQRRSWKHI